MKEGASMVSTQNSLQLGREGQIKGNWLGDGKG